jgi:tetratricopeptide (TPR) repeat protein
MKIFGMRSAGAGAAAACLLALATLGQPAAVLAQATGTIHGHVIDAAGAPLGSGSIRLTTDKSGGPAASKKYDYTFPVDATGNFKGDGIKPGTYVAVAFQGAISVDFLYNLEIVGGQDKAADFDMTRAEYVAKMSPEEKARLDDLKKTNAAANATNKTIENLNAVLTKSRADIKAGNFEPAVKAMTDATAAKPDEPVLWETLADAQLGDADAAFKAARDSHATDASLPGKYTAVAASYQKAITLNAAGAKPSQDIASIANYQLGQTLGKLALAAGQPDKGKDAVPAYDAAVKADPSKAGTYYYNEAATLFNAQDMDDAGAAADKAIAADPAKADAYYIKAQVLIQKSTVDEKAKPPKVITPPGCVEAYQKYLELAPTGAHAEEVKSILTGIGEPIKSTFKAGRG